MPGLSIGYGLTNRRSGMTVEYVLKNHAINLYQISATNAYDGIYVKDGKRRVILL